MTATEAQKLRIKFKKHPIEHKRNMVIETDRTYGNKTGDKVCSECGLTSYDIADQEKRGETDKWCK